MGGRDEHKLFQRKHTGGQKIQEINAWHYTNLKRERDHLTPVK